MQKKGESAMKEYEIFYKFVNGCAGEAAPQTEFDEAELNDPADYIRSKHPVDHGKFVRQERDGTIVYCYDTGTVKYIYEFTEI